MQRGGGTERCFAFSFCFAVFFSGRGGREEKREGLGGWEGKRRRGMVVVVKKEASTARVNLFP